MPQFVQAVAGVHGSGLDIRLGYFRPQGRRSKRTEETGFGAWFFTAGITGMFVSCSHVRLRTDLGPSHPHGRWVIKLTENCILMCVREEQRISITFLRTWGAVDVCCDLIKFTLVDWLICSTDVTWRVSRSQSMITRGAVLTRLTTRRKLFRDKLVCANSADRRENKRASFMESFVFLWGKLRDKYMSVLWGVGQRGFPGPVAGVIYINVNEITAYACGCGGSFAYANQ